MLSILALLMIIGVQLSAQPTQNDNINAICKKCPKGTKKGTNLIKNSDFQSGNVDFTSNLTYQATGTLSDGKYSIRHSANLGNGQWAAIDHTTNTSKGLFLVSDGQANRVTWKQTVAVSPKTKYIFCAFVNNLVVKNKNYTDPRIEVRINGTAVVSQTIAENPDQWINLSTGWGSGSSTSATIEILCTTSGAVGNDWALDDVSFHSCTPIEEACHNCPRGSVPGPNMVKNGDFEAHNVDFSSTLTYKASGLLKDGDYGVRNSTNLVNGQWKALDHTNGFTDGLFLACDGKAGRESWKQKIAVKPETNYSFCAFFNNLVKANKNYTDPLIEVYINGTKVIGPTALSETPDTWVNMTALWNSGSATSAVIVIKTAANASVGNDYAIDDISFRACKMNSRHIKGRR